MKSGIPLSSISHHAYYLIGSDSLRNELRSILEDVHEIPAQGNPDFFDQAYETFTIDNARELKASHGMRPVHESGKKIFIITMNGVTVEAQNALLKLLEEPAEYAHFFLIVPSAHLLLPTVKSRMALIEVAPRAIAGDRNLRQPHSGVGEEAQKFLKLSPAKRLEVIKSLVDEISKEKKTKQDAIVFLDSIEKAVYEKGVKEGRELLEQIQLVRRYIHDRAPSVKMLLEYMALNVG